MRNDKKNGIMASTLAIKDNIFLLNQFWSEVGYCTVA